MKLKKLFIVLLLILIAIPSSAQLLPFTLEVRGGINRSEPSIKHFDEKSRISYRADAVMDFKMGLGFFTRTGLTVTEKNAKINIDAIPYNMSAKVKAQYLEIPAMVGYKLGIYFLL